MIPWARTVQPFPSYDLCRLLHIMKFIRHPGDLSDRQTRTLTARFLSRTDPVPAAHSRSEPVGRFSFFTSSEPGLRHANTSLARLCRHTAMRMSWLGNLRQRRCPAQTGSNPITLLARASFLLSGLGAALLAAQTVAGSGEVLGLDKLTIEGHRPDAYTAAAANSISKLPITLLENPQNIQVVPRSLIDDQGALKLNDIIGNVAGVVTGGYYENWDYFRIRGFAADFNTYIDGLRGGNGMGEETFGLEQVEIIKGPASSLFGGGPLGGLVNLVSKHPRSETFTEIEFTAGDFDYRAFTLDTNAPLGSPNLLFRLPVLIANQDSFIDVAEKQTLFLAPTLTWKISTATSLTLLGKYKEIDLVHAMPLPAAGTVLPNPNGSIPPGVFNGEPGSNHAYENSGQIGYELVHRFNDVLTLRQNARYDRFVQGWRDMLYPSYLDADNRTLYRYPYNYWQDWHDFAVDTRLEAAFAAGGVAHQLIAGVDQFRKHYSARFQTIDFGDPVGYIGIDLYHPVYGTPIPAYQPIGTSEEKTLNTGVYLHDHVKLGRGVTVTAGGRHDFARGGGTKFEEFTPSVGATWELHPQTVLYANYSESFNAQGTWMTTVAGTPVDPETGDNRELGLKRSAADGRLTATLAVFQLTRQNVATPDLANPGYYLVTGGQRSRGVEFDGRFSPFAGWEITAAYAYTDARITRDNALPVGARTTGVPYHTVNFWTKYRFQEGPFEGFGAGAGFRYYSAQSGDETHATFFELPPYALVDFALYYERGPFTAQLNIKNAFDRDHYSGAYDSLYVLPGEPRSLRASVGWKF